MKNVILIAVLTVFAMSYSFAQDDQEGSSSSQSVSFGVKAGANFASLTGDDTDDLDGRTSFHAGGVVNISISELFAVQPEVVYSAQGFTLSEDGMDITGKLDYINVPILADFTLAEGFSIQGGPQVGFNITKEFEADGVSVEIENVESVIFDAAVGAQYRLPIGLFFQARYVFGISNATSEADTDIKNSVASVSAGWFFD
jgi:Outer membrane protein beta-barrel domain